MTPHKTAGDMFITGEPLPLKKEFSVNLPVASPAFRNAALVPEEMRPNRPHEPPKQPAPSRTAEGPACLLPPAQPLRGWEKGIRTRQGQPPRFSEAAFGAVHGAAISGLF